MIKKPISEKSFGGKLPGIDYRDRTGAYGIWLNNENKIPVIKTAIGFFLLGGGIAVFGLIRQMLYSWNRIFLSYGGNREILCANRS